MSAIPIVAGGGVLSINGSVIGNVNKFQFSPKFELARYNDYSTGIKRTGIIRVASRQLQGSFLTDYITLANMSLFINAAHIDAMVFYSANPVPQGVNPIYTFIDVTIVPGGETQLIIEADGDTWQGLTFAFEGTLTMPDVTFVPAWDPPAQTEPPSPEDGDQFITVVAGGSLSGQHAVIIGEDGEAYYADRSNLDHVDIVAGVTTGAISAHATGSIQTSGRMIEETWNWTMEQSIYLSINGLLTQTAPTSGFVLYMGFPLSPTSMFIRIGIPIILS
jgi:hypothetical protein